MTLAARSKMQSAAPAFKNYLFIVVGMAFLLATGIAFAGVFSDLSLGDEVYQYRFAKLWYETGQRPVYDPLLETNFRCLYYFDPMSIPTYLGIHVLLFLPNYLILRRQKSEDLILLLPVVFYFIEYLYFFHRQ